MNFYLHYIYLKSRNIFFKSFLLPNGGFIFPNPPCLRHCPQTRTALAQHCAFQRRQSGLKSGGSWIRVKKFRFFRKISKKFGFFQAISESKKAIFRANFRKISIFSGDFTKNFVFQSKFSKNF